MTIRRVINNNASLQVREQEGKPPRLTGYAIVFGTASLPLYSDADETIREVIAPEAVTQQLLDTSDIVMTMFHNDSMILARSAAGKGTLSYSIDEHGVKFDFEPPQTEDGKKAVELVKRGDIAGCSFAFSTDYSDRESVECSITSEGGKRITTYTVRKIKGLYDFTLTPHPAYPATSVEAREAAQLGKSLKQQQAKQTAPVQSEETRRKIDELKKEAQRLLNY